MRMFQVCVCGQPLQLNEQPTPKPTGSEVLLKVWPPAYATATCIWPTDGLTSAAAKR